MSEEKLTQTQEYNKALWQFNRAVTEILSLYDKYGMDVYNKEGDVTREIEKIAVQFHARIMGVPDIEIGREFELVSIVSTAPDD